MHVGVIKGVVESGVVSDYEREVVSGKESSYEGSHEREVVSG